MTAETGLAVKTGALDIERVVVMGDLSSLKPEERLEYYRSVCNSMGLNPLTKPFDYITLNGKLTLYARKDATDQLRKLHGVSIVKLEREKIEDIYTVTAYAVDLTGRQDSSIGAVSIGTLRGDALANAIMKAETKSKRRVTLSICGLGMLDETELETIPNEVKQTAPTLVISTPTNGKPAPAPEPQAATAQGQGEARRVEVETETRQIIDPPTAPTAYIGKRKPIGKTLYPEGWDAALAPFCKKYAEKKFSLFEADGILQKLALPETSSAEYVAQQVEAYLTTKYASN